MSAPADLTPASAVDDAASARAALRPTKPFYWSLRRELWENRSILIAPLAVAAVMLFGGVVGVFSHHTVTAVRTTATVTQNGAAVTRGAHVAMAMTPAQKAALANVPYDFVGVALLVTLFIVALFYCLGALHNERRDRSILFWKSLPVSDLTTVSAKAVLPLAILPAVVLAITLAVQLVMLLLSAATTAAQGKDAAAVLAQAPIASMPLLVLYALVALTLWWAPLYAWLLLVSGWARRGAFLWAVLPPLLVAVTEKIAFDTGYVSSLISYRLMGGFHQAFVIPTKAEWQAGTALPDGLPQMDPGKFLATPGLWVGLVVAAAFFAAAVWLRRRREPV
jgi:ABC-2 type transport system permease protein